MSLLARGSTRDHATSFDRRLIAPMILGSALNPINTSIIAVSLVPIGRAFGAPPSQTAWLVSALYLATAIGQPVVGRLVDTFGPRRLYLIGTSLVGIAGVIGLIAPNLPTLVGARVLLGFGTCAGYPAAMYLIRAESRRTGQDSPAGVLTALAVANQTIAVIGPTLGGLLIGIGGWRSTLAVNVPLSIACLVLGSLRLPKHVSVTDDTTPRRGFDLGGMALFAATLVSLLLFLMEPHVDLTWLLALTLLTGAGFVVLEKRITDPFVDLRVLAGNLPLVLTYARSLLTAIVSYGFLYGFTQWLEDGRGLSASQAGLVLLPVFGTGLLVSTATGRRPEIRGKLLVGSVAQIAACLLMFFAHGTSPIWMLVTVALVVGIPQGLNNLANQNAVYYQAEPDRIASSAGLLRTFSYLGAIIVAAANGLFLHNDANTSGLHHLAIFLTVAAGLMLVVTVADRSLGRVGNPAAASTA